MRLITRNPLEFPAGFAPGFNPNHIVGSGISPNFGFSGISVGGGGFINLLNGAPGTKGGAPTGNISGVVGPNTVFSADGDVYNFSGNSTAASDATMGAIFYLNITPANNQTIFCSSSGAGAGWLLALNTSHVIGWWNGSTASNSTIALSAGIPYFLAANVNASTANFVVMNLSTGSIVPQTISGLAQAAPNGTYQVGYDGASLQQLRGGIAAVMFAPKYSSMQQLLAWAADPWSFWYPSSQDYALDEELVSSGGFQPAWAIPSNYIPSGGWAT